MISLKEFLAWAAVAVIAWSAVTFAMTRPIAPDPIVVRHAEQQPPREIIPDVEPIEITRLVHAIDQDFDVAPPQPPPILLDRLPMPRPAPRPSLHYKRDHEHGRHHHHHGHKRGHHHEDDDR